MFHPILELRSSRIGLGGTKLERSSPWQSRSAIHSASFTSVLRSGTFLMCCAFATTISNAPSKSASIGFPYTPVLSLATWGQPSESNHSRRPHQLSRRGAERSHLLLDFPVPANHQQASHYRALMYVQSTTPFDQSLHNVSSGGDCYATGPVRHIMRPSRLRVRQKVIPLPARVSLIGGICVITSATGLQAIANYGCLYPRLTRFSRSYVASPLNPIFMLGGAPEAHEVVSKTPRIEIPSARKSLPRGVSDQG
jgi:hypothetical protein